VLVAFKTHRLEEKQQQKCSEKYVHFGRIRALAGILPEAFYTTMVASRVICE
jgi:hypothetical protein